MSDPEELYLVKYKKDIVGDSSNQKDLFWGPNETWVKDPTIATRFTKDQGTMIVGKLLVDQEWVTKLVPVSQVPMVKPVCPPSSNYIIIADNEGNPVNIYSRSSATNEHIGAKIVFLDYQNYNQAPHSAWMYDSGGHSRLFPPTLVGEVSWKR